MPSRMLATLCMLVATLAMGVSASAADAENPLEPLDASSPRAAFLSFLEQTRVVEEATLAYRADRSLDTQSQLIEAVARTAQLSDLSEVPGASLEQVVAENFAALADILLRVPLPDPETIPDADMVSERGLTRWTLPGTEVTFTRLEEGDRAGNWVLSSRTVANLSAWRELVEGLPVLVEGAVVNDWRRNTDLTTGPLIPSGLVGALPALAKERMLGAPVWKSLAALLGAVLVVAGSLLWHRWIGRRGPKESVRGHVLGATTPLVLLGLLSVYGNVMSTQVNLSGQLAEMVVLGTTIAFWIAVAWLLKESIDLAVEWTIGTPRISNESYDPHLLRLVSRIVSVVGVGFVLLFGANEIGIPALGLLAGASVGGLVVGLAAQGTVENLIGGITLFADKPFQVGDVVGFGEDSGTVEEIGPRSTRIRKLDGTRLTVPNSDIVQARISNLTHREKALFLHTVGLRYETTVEQIEWLVARIREGLRDHPMVVSDENLPRVRLAAFGASSIDIEVRAYVDTNDIHEFMAVQAELLARILRLVEAAGTSLAFPSTTAYLTRDGGIKGPIALPEQSGQPAAAGPDARTSVRPGDTEGSETPGLDTAQRSPS